MDKRRVTIDPTTAGQRLDRVLAGALPELSRTRLQALIAAGSVHELSGARVTRATKVRAGQSFVVALPPPIDARPQAQVIPLTIVYEDSELIVVDKPAGLVVHPAPGNPDLTLVNALLAHCGDSLSGIGGVRRPGIVHRLDKDTSGLMVAAKTDQAHRSLSAQFAAHSVGRVYVAVVWGAPKAKEGVIEGAIGRNPRQRKQMTVLSHGGKPAVTRYRVISTLGRPPLATQIECRLETGRTHQIRVHMASIGHPLLGDSIYGRRPRRRAEGRLAKAEALARALGRQALDARALAFDHPTTGRRLQFDREMPKDLRDLISSLESL